MSDDLVAFLNARLDEDEQTARTAKDNRSGTWTCVETTGGDYRVLDSLGYSVSEYPDVESQPWWTHPHIARHDPARILAEVDAKRRIIARCVYVLDNEDYGHWLAAQVLKDLASTYATAAGYRPGWAPDA